MDTSIPKTWWRVCPVLYRPSIIGVVSLVVLVHALWEPTSRQTRRWWWAAAEWGRTRHSRRSAWRTGAVFYPCSGGKAHTGRVEYSGLVVVWYSHRRYSALTPTGVCACVLKDTDTLRCAWLPDRLLFRSCQWRARWLQGEWKQDFSKNMKKYTP